MKSPLHFIVPVLGLVLSFAATAAAQQAELIRSHGTPGNRNFGYDVAAIGDLDGDGRPDYAIGAPDLGTFGLDGAVYSYSGATGALVRTFVPPTAGRQARFGASVAGTGDLNGDGAPDLLIGEPDHDGATGEQGRAYLMSGASGGVLKTFVAPSTATTGNFGEAVATIADVDGNGSVDLLVGAPGANAPTQSFSGQVFLYSGASGVLLRSFHSPTPRNGGNFGLALAGVDDIDGDGAPDMLIGAPNEGATAFAGYGFVHLFSGATGALLDTIGSPNPSDIGRFGRAVEPGPDVTGDRRREVLIGAPNEGNPGTGMAYLFDLVAKAAIVTFDAPPNVPAAVVGSFGTSLASIGDITSDGVPDVLIGDPNFRDTGFVPPLQSGRAHLYDGATGAELASFRSPQEQGFGQFAFAVAAAGDIDGDGDVDFVVGAYAESNGRAYVYGPDAPIAFCFGDGSTSLACPCGNTGAAGHGCANSVTSGGARLQATGSTAPDALVLVASDVLPTALTIFLQGDGLIAGGTAFGDGVRCAGGQMLRLASKNAVQGTAQFPGPGEPSISARSAALGSSIPPGATRHYQAYYRDPESTFCPEPQGSTFNVTNGIAITWP